MALLTAKCGIGERGQALLEYAALVAVIGIGIVAVLGLIGHVTSNAYQRSANSVAVQVGSGQAFGGGAPALRIIPAGSRPPSDSASADPDSAGTTQAH